MKKPKKSNKYYTTFSITYRYDEDDLYGKNHEEKEVSAIDQSWRDFEEHWKNGSIGPNPFDFARHTEVNH